MAASCILMSDLELNVSTSLVDDEGVDLVFHRKDYPARLAVQVKSRSTDTRQVMLQRRPAFPRLEAGEGIRTPDPRFTRALL